MSGGVGYSGTPLPRKLGLEFGMRVRLLDAPAGYWELLGAPPSEFGVTPVEETGEHADFTHLFATDRGSLEAHFRTAWAGMTEAGLVWASWPKKSSDLESEIGRADVMAAGKEIGLVDVKVCAVDGTWSGLKFVIPVADRSSR